MLKIWLKLVLKGRCARKSRSGFEGCLDASERSSDYGASSRLFNFLFFYFFYFLPLEPGSSMQADSGRLLLTPSGANFLGPLSIPTPHVDMGAGEAQIDLFLFCRLL